MCTASWRLAVISMVLGVGTLGCGVTTEREEALLQQPFALEADNGLSTNGLSTNGLQHVAFTSWFNESPEVRAEVMKYLILCALPKDAVRTYTNAKTNTVYVWTGRLGLAARWGSGLPATEQEEQVVSACLAAHTNPYGLHVPFSLQGRTAEGQELGYTDKELQDYAVHESCFFGNLFRGQGVYAGNDRMQMPSFASSLRGCGLSGVTSGVSPECPGIQRVSCASACTLEASGRYHTECVLNGKSYRPLTTRIQLSTLALCGDGVCQPSEKCGSANTPNRCGADCGACP